VSTQRSALGRGLGALIPGARGGAPTASGTPLARTAAGENTHRAVVEAEAGKAVLAIPINEIVPNPEQPRRRFEEIELEQLAASIRQHGVLQPVVVERTPDGYQLLVGERRWRAAQRAGLARIPAILADVAGRERLELALIENIQRQDLNPIELALSFRTLVQAGLTQEEVGQRVALDRSSIANYLRLLDLPREWQQDLEEGHFTMGHAKALLQVENLERRRHLHERIRKEQLSVRAAEEIARRLSGGRPPSVSPSKSRLGPDLEHLVDLLRERFKTRIRLAGGAAKGRIEIEYYSPADLQRIAAELLGA